MPRRKFRNTPRFETPAERSFQEYMLNTPAPVTTRTELLRLIRGGEDTYLELKVKLSNPERIAQGIVALANTAGGTIVFGVSDQLRVEGVADADNVRDELVRICREEIVPALVPLIDIIAFDNGRRLVVIDIDPKRRPYRTRDGRFYQRIGAEKREVGRDELSAWLDEIRPLAYENMPLPEIRESDFDDALLWSFADAFDIDSLGRNFYQTADFLKKDLLLAFGAADEFVATVAGVLLFGKNEVVSTALPRARVRLVRVTNAGSQLQTVEETEVSGNLLTLYESCLRFILRYVDLDKGTPGKKREATSDQRRMKYPVFAVREAVANLLMHRDLAVRDVASRIVISDDSIEFGNPRRTMGFAPPSSRAIRYGITQRLNPQIAAIFSKREYGTNVPRGGLPMLLRDAHKFAAKRAEILTSNDDFRVRIFGA